LLCDFDDVRRWRRTIADDEDHHWWCELNSIPPIVKADKFIHSTNTPRSHLYLHCPSPITLIECYECDGGSRGRTSRFPAAVSVIASIVIMGSPKSLSKQRTLVSQYHTTNVETIQIPPPWCWDGFVCLHRWRSGDGFIFNGCVGRYKKGGSALLVPAMWDDTYLTDQDLQDGVTGQVWKRYLY
jgi:hypothetical protein